MLRRNIDQFVFFVLFLILFLVPLDFGGHSSRAAVSLAVLSFISLSFWLVLGCKSPTRLKFILALMALFLGLSFLSAIFSPYKYLSLSKWIDYAAIFIVFFLSASITRGKMLELAPVILFFSALWTTIIGVYFFFTTNFAGIEASFYSTFYQQDTFAGFILTVLPLGIVVYLGSLDLKYRIFYGIGSVLMCVALVLSHSRGAWLIFLFTTIPLIFYVVRNKINRQFWIKLIIFLILVCMGAAYFSMSQKKGSFVPSLREDAASVVSVQDASYQARWSFYKAALSILKDHPLLGIGFGNFGDFYPRYVKDGRFYSRYVHNFYLQLGCESGLPQALIFIVILFLIFKEGLRVLKYAKEEENLLIGGALIGLLANLAHSFIDVDWQFLAIPAYFFFLAGFVFATGLRLDGEEELAEIKFKFSRFVAAYILILSIPFILFPFFADCLNKSARFFQDNKKNKEAYALYEKAVKFNPFNYEYHKNLAGLYFEDSGIISLNDAAGEAEKSVRLCPEKAILRQFFAKFLYAKGDYDGFLREMNMAIAKDPVNYPSFYNDLGFYYLNSKEYEKSEIYYLKAIGLFPEETLSPMWYFRVNSVKRQLSASYLGLAGLYSVQGKKKEAGKCFKKAQELNENE